MIQRSGRTENQNFKVPCRRYLFGLLVVACDLSKKKIWGMNVKLSDLSKIIVSPNHNWKQYHFYI